MIKEIKFFITDYRNFHNIVNSPIRSKEDIIKILLLSIKNILLEKKFDDEDKGEVYISIDKSSRIYFICKNPGELPNKYYSFIFPFFLIKDEDEKWCVKCKTSLETITSELIECLLVLIDKGWFSEANVNSDNIEKFACDYMDIVGDYYDNNVANNNQSIIEVSHWSIIKNLFTFEPSYVRYDYDPIHEDGDIHPLNHMDIHYTSSGTFKLGFDKSMNIKERLEFCKFKDILENGKSQNNICYKIK